MGGRSMHPTALLWICRSVAPPVTERFFDLFKVYHQKKASPEGEAACLLSDSVRLSSPYEAKPVVQDHSSVSVAFPFAVTAPVVASAV